MNKKLLFLIPVGVAIGILIYQYVDVASLLNLIQPTFTRVQAIWANLPDMVKGIITIGIPSMFAVFFAWTKTRAMDKLQQTKQEATQQVTQIQGEANEQISALKLKNEALQGQVGANVTTLATELSKVQDTVTSQKEQINRLTIQRNEAQRLSNLVMHPTEEDLIAKLKQSGYTIIRKAVA